MDVFFITCLIIYFLSVQGKSSKENDFTNVKDINVNEDYKKIYRRFFEDLNDDEWHVAHLRDQEFDFRRSDDPCGPQTFEEMVQKHKKSIRDDPGFVEYVSAFAIPVNESITDQKTCKKIQNHDKGTLLTKVTQKVSRNTGEGTVNPKLTNNNQVSHAEEALADKATSTTTDSKPLDQATTSLPKAVASSSKKENKTDSRRSEYIFSSAEYYDDTIDFDASTCPDAVEEIVLEIDQIRNYDVECERIIEWRSLESAG